MTACQPHKAKTAWPQKTASRWMRHPYPVSVFHDRASSGVQRCWISADFWLGGLSAEEPRVAIFIGFCLEGVVTSMVLKKPVNESTSTDCAGNLTKQVYINQIVSEPGVEPRYLMSNVMQGCLSGCADQDLEPKRGVLVHDDCALFLRSDDG